MLSKLLGNRAHTFFFLSFVKHGKFVGGHAGGIGVSNKISGNRLFRSVQMTTVRLYRRFQWIFIRAHGMEKQGEIQGRLYR